MRTRQHHRPAPARLIPALVLTPCAAALAQPVGAPGFAVEPFLTGVEATGMVRSAGGDGFAPGLYIATRDAILHLDDHGELTTFAAAPAPLGCIAFSRGYGFPPGLYAAQSSADEIYLFHPDGSSETFATLAAGGPVNLAELAFTTDAAGFGGALYATDYAGAGNNPGRIFRIESDGAFQAVFQNNEFTNVGLAFVEGPFFAEPALALADLRNYNADNDGGVWRFGADMSRHLLADTGATPLIDPADVIEAAGPLFGDALLVSDATADGVFTISPAGGVAPVASEFQFDNFWTDCDLLLEADGTLLVADGGSQTIWRITAEPACPPDLNGDGTVNTQDFLAYLNLWAAADPSADWNDDGVVNTQDFLAYLNDWAAAANNGGQCP